MTWEVCKLDENYEINTEYPYEIRRRSNKRIVSEWKNEYDFSCCSLSSIEYYKHRIIAYQWIDNPDNCDFVEHINGNRSDNRIENLRYKGPPSDNSNNMTVIHNDSDYYRVGYNYIDYEDLPDNLITVNKYNDFVFDWYYYSAETNRFYLDTGINCRELIIRFNKSGNAFVNAKDVDGIYRRIYFTVFKYQYRGLYGREIGGIAE